MLYYERHKKCDKLRGKSSAQNTLSLNVAGLSRTPAGRSRLLQHRSHKTVMLFVFIQKPTKS